MKMREETQEFKTKLQTIKEARRKEKTDLVQKRNKSVEEKEGDTTVTSGSIVAARIKINEMKF